MSPEDEIAGRYRLETLAGRGPMSEVWRAHDDTLDRTVALKVLSPTADLERFRREARAVASLAHEHVMRVFDYGEDEVGPFMALKWLPGGTLEERLSDGALPGAFAVRIATGIAARLAHLHEGGFVHRDLKPANVLFDEEDRPKLADFGLARSAAGAGTLTEAGTVLGTAAYISPEQAGGEPATPASDVYSFGVLLFRMLTGTLPFVADDALALVDMHRNRRAPAATSLNPAADPALAQLADSALAKDPAARPADGAALLAALGATPTAVLADDMVATQSSHLPWCCSRSSARCSPGRSPVLPLRHRAGSSRRPAPHTGRGQAPALFPARPREARPSEARPREAQARRQRPKETTTAGTSTSQTTTTQSTTTSPTTITIPSTTT